MRTMFASLLLCQIVAMPCPQSFTFFGCDSHSSHAQHHSSLAGKDKVSAFEGGEEGAGSEKVKEKAEKGQKGVLVTDTYAFNEQFT